MTIEEPSSIDVFSLVDGVPHLKISDAGLIADPAKRTRLFKSKLSTYQQTLESREFQQKYKNWHQAVITLVSPIEPNQEMTEIRNIQVESIDGEIFKIRVDFRIRKLTLGKK